MALSVTSYGSSTQVRIFTDYIIGLADTIYSDRGTGEKYRLPQYISEFKDQLQTKWSTLTVTDRLQLTARVNEIRASRKRLVRKEPAAILKDFNSSFKSMDIDVSKYTS